MADKNYTTPERAKMFDEIMPLLKAMTIEFRDASKKKPDAALNKRKVAVVNRMLQSVFVIVEGQASREYLDLLDEDDLPLNSDVSLMLGQALAAMETFRKKHFGSLDTLGNYGWYLNPSA